VEGSTHTVKILRLSTRLEPIRVLASLTGLSGVVQLLSLVDGAVAVAKVVEPWVEEAEIVRNRLDPR
jgi:hypothetical protein